MLYNKLCKTKKPQKSKGNCPGSIQDRVNFYSSYEEAKDLYHPRSIARDEGKGFSLLRRVLFTGGRKHAVSIVADFPCKLFHCLMHSVIVTPLCLETHRVILQSAFSKVKRDIDVAKLSLTQEIHSIKFKMLRAK